MEKTLCNEKTYIIFNEDEKSIYGSDRTDQYNEPRFYNRTKRGIKKAWEELEKKFDKNTTMYGASGILNENNIRTNSYCAMD